MAMLIRWQLARPGAPVPLVGKLLFGPSGGVISPVAYTALFTMHGTIMIFFAVTPILIGGLRQLPAAALARRARHGVPAAQHGVVLDHVRRDGRPDRVVLRAARPARGRLDRLRDALHDHRRARSRADAVGGGDLPQRRLVGDGGGQLHHHGAADARARDDLPADAAHRLGLLPDLDPERAVRAGAGGGDGPALLRPRARDAVLHRRDDAGRGGRSDPLPAPLLAVRPPRGLHPDPAGLGDRRRSLGLLRAQAGVRLPRDGRGARSAWWSCRRSSTATTCSPPA